MRIVILCCIRFVALANLAFPVSVWWKLSACFILVLTWRDSRLMSSSRCNGN